MENSVNLTEEETLKDLDKDLKYITDYLSSRKITQRYALNLALNVFEAVLINVHYSKDAKELLINEIKEIIKNWEFEQCVLKLKKQT